MFCQKCGSEIPDDAVICIGCGRAVQPIQQPIEKESNYRPVASVRRANKSFIIACLIVGGVFFPFFLIQPLRGDKTIYEVRVVIYIFGLIGLAGMLFGFWQAYRYVYRMWSMIQDEDARTTPGIAVGFLFIPFFNWYWAFQAYRGWAVDYNRFIQKNVLEAPRMPEGLFLTFAIIRILLRIPFLNFIIYPAWIVLLIVMFAYICNAINFFAKLEPQLPSNSKIENTLLQASEIQST